MVAGTLSEILSIKQADRHAQKGVKGYLGLFCKAFPLNKGVVQLSVGIADLPLVHKQLKALCHARLVSMPDNAHTHTYRRKWSHI